MRRGGDRGRRLRRVLLVHGAGRDRARTPGRPGLRRVHHGDGHHGADRGAGGGRPRAAADRHRPSARLADRRPARRAGGRRARPDPRAGGPVTAAERVAAERVAIVTGGGQGLGRAYAARLARAGNRVAVVDVAGDAARAAAEAIAADVGADRVSAHEADVTDEERVGAFVGAVVERWGRIDALVNNAGGALLPSAPFDSFDRADWTRVLDVNLTGQWLCARAVVPHMRAAGHGKIVNVSSTMVSKGLPVGLAPYVAAKAGVVGLTRALARELGPDGIRVNAIAPGYIPVETRKTVHTPQAATALRERMKAEQCLPVVGVPDDLCGAVAFLCSPASDFITGQVVNVDGGWAHG
ncbi:SDR family oxidoreductase [Actinomadura decatromicini]|uniref:SDR family oxidoreductase n=1 Tax=Actinomadura decatromicini TaxID=2604572 RepID=A0A5D3FRN2_9ACTN|nr:SDR family oxidoreductase [Actinomadura decatromicini]